MCDLLCSINTIYRLFLWELETQIRDLGGDYECFGLPWWNIGKDVAEYGFMYSEYSILNSGLGGIGNLSDNFCVTDGAFTAFDYEPHHCPDSWASNTGECCLRRVTFADNEFGGFLNTNAQVADAITRDDFYGQDDVRANTGIRSNIEFGPHGVARMCVYVYLYIDI